MAPLTKPGLNLVRRRLPQTDLNKGADHHPHHLVKKAIALELNRKQLSGIPKTDLMDRANCFGNRSTAIRREGTEVVSTDETIRRSGHDNAVERVANLPGTAVFQRRQD